MTKTMNSKNNKATDSEIIEFFRAADLWLEDDEGDCLDVQSLGDCHQALKLHLIFAICDEEAIVENEVAEGNTDDPEKILDEYFALLRNPTLAQATEEIWFINLHKAAELLGATVDDVLKEHDPSMER